MMTENESGIGFYGTRWCGSSMRARRLLDKHQVPYRWIDIDQDPEASAFVQEVNNGYRSVPTIVFPDGSILVEPSTAELLEKIKG
jgi:mycoredoxin